MRRRRRRRRRREEGRRGRQKGGGRAIELAITKLVYQGYLKPNVRYRTFAIAKANAPELENLEQQVMVKVRSNPEFKNLRSTRWYQTDNLRTRLEKLGIKVSEEKCIAFYSVVGKFYFCTFLSIVVVSSHKLLFSALPHGITVHPFGLYFLGVMYFILCLIIFGGRTFWGDRVLKDIRKKDVSFDPIKRFALYGESTLSGGVLDDLKQIYKAQEEADTGCGC